MTGAEVRSARQRLGVSQAQLAEALDVHPLTVSRWERGERNPPAMAELAIGLLELAVDDASTGTN